MQWSLQNIAKLKSSLEHVLRVHCKQRGAENVKARKNTKCWCKCFWLILSTKIENIWKQYLTKNLNHQHLRSLPHNDPMRHEVSPPISSSEATAGFVLRIHGRLGLEEPLDHGIVAVDGCEVQRCYASGAAARGQATGRTQTKGRENFGASKVKVLKIGATQNPLWT